MPSNTHSHSTIAICADINGYGVQYRTSFVHAHCVCTWLLTITCIIMHRHCLSQTTNMTHAPLIVVHFSFSNLSISKREPKFVSVRSRRPVEHAREMRLFLDPSDHWLPFNRVQMWEGNSLQLNPRDSVLSQFLSRELTFQYCMQALRIWRLEYMTPACSVALTCAE